ncbi:MAG: hypothetical protein ACXVRP_00235, partial [Solirubrobacteraceae bacterium]
MRRPLTPGLLRARWGTDRGDPHTPLGRARVLGLLVWAAFILAPIADAITNSGSPTEHLLAIGAAVLFSAAYVWLVMTWFEEQARWRPVVLAGVMLVLATTLTLADRPSWGFLFTYAAACIGLVVPSRWGLPAVLACAAIAAVCAGIAGAGGGAAGGYAVSAVGIGL